MIKKALLSHVPDLMSLETQCFPTDQLEAKHFRYLVKSKTVRVFVYQRRKRAIAAAIILFRKNSKVARLYSIAVDPKCQRSGIAKKLYLSIEKYLQNRRMHEFRLEVRNDNKRAIRFYKKNGFDIFGEHKKYYQDGMNALRMRKQFTG